MKNFHHFRTDYALDTYSQSRALWDPPVFESASFVALPTVGALVEGWLLIVPREPALNFAGISPSAFSEFEGFLHRVAFGVESEYGPVSVFEHGPAGAQTCVGCGVDYAHFHVVPGCFGLLEGAKRIAPNIKWEQVGSVKDIRSKADLSKPYWFVQQTLGAGPAYVGRCLNDQPPSQLFRKVIAEQMGRALEFDWKKFPGEALIAATVEKLSKHTVPA